MVQCASQFDVTGKSDAVILPYTVYTPFISIMTCRNISVPELYCSNIWSFKSSSSQHAHTTQSSTKVWEPVHNLKAHTFFGSDMCTLRPSSPIYLFMVAQHNINFRSINWQHLDHSPFLSTYFTERHNERLHFWVAVWTLVMIVGPIVPLTSVCRWVWMVQEILWVQAMMSQETEVVFSRSVYFI